MIFFFKQKTAYEMLRSLVGSEMCIRDRLKTSFLMPVTSSSNSFPIFSQVVSFSILFTLSDSRRASTYSLLSSSPLVFIHLLKHLIFSFTAVLTRSVHHGVCFFFVPPTIFIPIASSALFNTASLKVFQHSSAPCPSSSAAMLFLICR